MNFTLSTTKREYCEEYLIPIPKEHMLLSYPIKKYIYFFHWELDCDRCGKHFKFTQREKDLDKTNKALQDEYNRLGWTYKDINGERLSYCFQCTKEFSN